MRTIDRSPERDAALEALLPHIQSRGWTTTALRRGLTATGADPTAAEILFTSPADMVEAYIDYADRRMTDAAHTLPDRRVSTRVRALIALRLAQSRPERPAIRQAFALLALPHNAATAARATARTVDTIWHEAGDTAADASWYSKRALLAAIYSATLLFWLRHDEWSDPEDAATLAFLDRRLDDIKRLGQARARISETLAKLLPPKLRDNPPTKAAAP